VSRQRFTVLWEDRDSGTTCLQGGETKLNQMQLEALLVGGICSRCSNLTSCGSIAQVSHDGKAQVAGGTREINSSCMIKGQVIEV